MRGDAVMWCREQWLRALILHKLPTLERGGRVRLVVTLIQRDTFVWSSLQAGRGVLHLRSNRQQPITVTLPVGCWIAGRYPPPTHPLPMQCRCLLCDELCAVCCMMRGGVNICV
jgi:hypothetical protein